MRRIVRYLRHLPAAGSLGVPGVDKEEEEQHEHMRGGEEKDKHHLEYCYAEPVRGTVSYCQLRSNLRGNL